MDFTGDDYFRGCNAGFDSGYMFCDSTLVAMDVFHTFSTLRQTRILTAFLLHSFEWRRVPSRCFWMQFCSSLFALGILDVFLELHVTELLDDGRVFSPLSAAFFGLLFGVEALVCQLIPVAC